MSELVSVKVHEGQLKEVQRLLAAYPKGVAKVQVRAINKVATAARKQISDNVRASINVQAGELKRRNIHITIAKRSSLHAHIKVSGGRMPLRYFGVRQKKEGVSYEIRRKGGRKTIPGTFKRNDGVGQMKGVWKRISKGRLPITELHGPSIPFVVDGIPNLAEGRYEKELVWKLGKEIDRQVRVLLEKGK